jgi:glycosyltransferase involved in cell wall biosynthesis
MRTKRTLSAPRASLVTAMIAGAATLLAACTLGPNYARPGVEAPPAYKEAQGWKPAEPRETEPRGPWWKVFNDPQLDALLGQVEVSNQTIKAAEARVREARALTQQAQAAFFPIVTGNASATRSGGGGLDGRHDLTIYVTDGEAARIRAFAPRAELDGVADDAIGVSIADRLDRAAHDVLFCPTAFLDPQDPPLPCAVELNDLMHEFLPGGFREEDLAFRRERYPAAARRADVVLTPSRFSRETIVDRYGVAPERIAISGRDVDAAFRAPPRPELVAPLGLPPRYLHFPANFWPHKDHATALRALARLDGVHGDIALVLTGAVETGWADVAEQVRALGLEPRVRMLGYLERPELAEVLRGAQALLFPSRFEGFGAPVLEAFHVGTPVVATTAGAIPEVAGDAALLVEPGDAEGLARAAARVLDDGELAGELGERGRERTGAHDWSQVVANVERELGRVAAG